VADVDIRPLIESSDTDGLLRVVDGLCAARDWNALTRIQVMCREALARGRQLWSVDHHIDYRLALEAPGDRAGAVITESASRFLLGPLPEVAASTHTWAQIGSHIPVGPARAMTAHERVVRGEDLDADDTIDPHVLELPLRLESWEPAYALATYHSHRADFPMPRIPSLEMTELPAANTTKIQDISAADALTGIVATWVESSNGRADVSAVEGTASEAIAALGLRRAAVAELTVAEAMALIGWAGASGGAYGRRRGAASGRFTAWWTAAVLTDLAEDWPVPGDELAHAAAELRWFAFSDLFPTTGWAFHLAVEDRDHGLAWAIAAGDAA
jgi:hypothetical protein